MEGDHIMTDESVEVERSVGFEVLSGLHERDVIIDSWPTSSASNVTENC